MVIKVLETAASLALKGVPAIKAALHGARLGAGAAFGKSTVEALGVVVGEPNVLVNGPVGVVLKEGAQGPVLSALAASKKGVSLRLGRGGALAASVSEETVRAVARTTARGAMSAIGRATAAGALGGAAIDAVITGVSLAPKISSGELAPKDAAKAIGKNATRGAVSGAAGVLAASVVSAGVAAAGLTVAGAPVVVPLVAMMAAGTLASRAFDKRFGTKPVDAAGEIGVTEKAASAQLAS